MAMPPPLEFLRCCARPPGGGPQGCGRQQFGACAGTSLALRGKAHVSWPSLRSTIRPCTGVRWPKPTPADLSREARRRGTSPRDASLAWWNLLLSSLSGWVFRLGQVSPRVCTLPLRAVSTGLELWLGPSGLGRLFQFCVVVLRGRGLLALFGGAMLLQAQPGRRRSRP